MPFLIVACGAALRLIPAVAHEFPLRDGGMFVVMVEDLLTAGFTLPDVTSYNQLNIPFVYPPLAFYLAAMLARLLDQPPIEVLRWLPASLAAATVPAMYLAAREILRTHPWPHGAAVATFAYAVSPRAFDWLIGAGGLPRALGLLFALLVCERALVALRTGRARTRLEAGVLAGLTLLSHPQTPIFFVASVLVLGAFALRSEAIHARAAVLRLIGIASIASAVALPWLALLAFRGEFGALVGIGGRWALSMDLPVLLRLPFTPSAHIDVAGLCALLVLGGNLLRLDLRLPLWILAVVLLGTGGGAFLVAVPAAAIVGGFVARSASRPAPRSVQVVATIAGAALAALALVIAIEEYALSSSRPFQLSTDARAAIARLDATLEPGAGVATIASRGWGTDLAAEWLPAISRLHGATTVQGSEWLGHARWLERADASARMNLCGQADAACLDAALATLDAPVQAVMILGPPDGLDSPALVESLRSSRGYRLTFESGNVLVFTPIPRR